MNIIIDLEKRQLVVCQLAAQRFQQNQIEQLRRYLYEALSHVVLCDNLILLIRIIGFDHLIITLDSNVI